LNRQSFSQKNLAIRHSQATTFQLGFKGFEDLWGWIELTLVETYQLAKEGVSFL